MICTVRELTEAPFLNFFDDEVRGDPAAALERVRPEGPVVQTSGRWSTATERSASC